MDVRKTPEMIEEGQKNALKWLLSDPEAEEILKELPYFQELAAGSSDEIKSFDALTEEQKAKLIKELEASQYLYQLAYEKAIGKLQQRDSGQAFINDSPVVKNLLKREKGDIVLGTNEETGEPAIFTIYDGYLTPIEKEIVEDIAKFWLDGQVTKDGNIFHTVGQLYRAMRPGMKGQSPTKEQRGALMDTLNGLERKITFKLNDYLKVWGGFETNGGRIPLLSFSEFFGKIRGQEDLLIVHSNISILCLIAKNLHMYERPAQEVKAIEQLRYTLKLKEPLQISGKPVTKRSFATNEERRKFCRKYGIAKEDIAEYGESSKPWALSENRIALRSVLLTFVYGYIRARAVNKPHSNKLPYATIFERCEVNTNSRELVKRAKTDIGVIMAHFVRKIPELKGWGEYTNKDNKKADGVEIFLRLPEVNGG